MFILLLFCITLISLLFAYYIWIKHRQHEVISVEEGDSPIQMHNFSDEVVSGSLGDEIVVDVTGSLNLPTVGADLKNGMEVMKRSGGRDEMKRLFGSSSDGTKDKNGLGLYGEDLEMHSNWMIDQKDVTLGRQVGFGSFGVVYEGKWAGVPVAIKVLHTDSISDNNENDIREMVEENDEDKKLQRRKGQKNTKFNELKREMQLLATLNHPNIVRFFGCVVDPPNFYLVSIDKYQIMKIIWK